jgi:hypothetical protein
MTDTPPMNRRGLLVLGLIAAPAIVRARSLMPLRGVPLYNNPMAVIDGIEEEILIQRMKDAAVFNYHFAGFFGR